MAISFRTTLLLIFTALLGLVLSVMTWAVLRATDASAKANAHRELEVAERVFATLLAENGRQLTDRTLLLAEDFGFKQAIATNEESTLVSVLGNHGDRIGADMIVLMSPSGEILISSHELGEDIAVLGGSLSGTKNAFSVLTIAENVPYQLVLVPVQAPGLVAWVGMGFALDAELMESFKNITQANVTLIVHDNLTGKISTYSTLADAEKLAPTLESVPFDPAVARLDAGLAELGWLSRQSVLLNRTGQQLGMVLSVSLQDALAAYRKLQQQMLLIAGVALVLAILVVIAIAQGISRPIDLLVRAARRIASGDYSRAVAVARQAEFGILGSTLNAMQHAIQEREKHIKYQAQHDLQTGLPNQEQLAFAVEQRFSMLDASPFAAVLVQIVNLHALSDVYGLALVNRLLPLLAERLRGTLARDSVTDSMADNAPVFDKQVYVSRVGTDEFVLLVNDAEASCAGAIAEQFTCAFSRAFQSDNIEVKIDVRLGFVFCPEHARNYEDLVRRAHIALADARHRCLPYVCYAEGRDEEHLRKIVVTERLQHAIANSAFELLYQPQFDFKSGRIHSAEALIRWNDSELGRMFPDEFIPLAEQSGDITLITQWVLNEAIQQLQQWQREGIDMGVSINLSARDILKDDFIDALIERIERDAIPKNRLMLEITESAMIEDAERAIRNLQRLYDFGVSLAMDDFGTGFSSLAQLKAMPIHELKIDKSFVLKLDQDIADQRIVKSTIEMAHHLGLSVIAEGVENQASLLLLKHMGCDAIQGYFLTRPMPLKDLYGWLREFNRDVLEAEHA